MKISEDNLKEAEEISTIIYNQHCRCFISSYDHEDVVKLIASALQSKSDEITALKNSSKNRSLSEKLWKPSSNKFMDQADEALWLSDLARQTAAKLIPHTTSVHNVTVIEDALRKVRKEEEWYKDVI